MYKLKKMTGYKIIGKERGNLVVDRPDGLRIFLNDKDDDIINHIRLYAKRKDVILSIGLYRGLQISQNYKKRYADDLDVDYMKFMDNILQVVSKVKLLKINRGGTDEKFKQYIKVHRKK